jgi:putative flavoprotein involved in K+ transport
MSIPSPDRPPLDVLVIGGGQAGLAMGHQLNRRGRPFEIVDAGPEIGHVWRSRWDSLRLFTSGRYDNLPGLPFPAAADSDPGKDDVADYLQAYAARFGLPVRPDTTVTSLTRTGGVYVAKAGQRVFEARQVVLATGAFQVPFTPEVSAQLDADVHQIHSIDYRRPGDLPLGRLLVVGAANSGCQIALELSATHSVDLSIGRRIPTIPQRPLGRDVWAWATGIRLDRITADSRIGRRLSQRDQVIGAGQRRLARRHGVRLRPRVSEAAGRVRSGAPGRLRRPTLGHQDQIGSASPQSRPANGLGTN